MAIVWGVPNFRVFTVFSFQENKDNNKVTKNDRIFSRGLSVIEKQSAI